MILSPARARQAKLWLGGIVLAVLLLAATLLASLRSSSEQPCVAAVDRQEVPQQTAAPIAPSDGIRLTNVTERSGIRFVHDDGGSGEKYLVEAISAGLALLDYDGDGLLDIYFLCGAPLPPRSDGGKTNRLYRNEGDLRFRDVTEAAGVGDRGFGSGVAVADYDNDGWPDIYVNNFGPNVLYRNNGDGTFSDVTPQAGLDNGEKMGAGVAFLDIDGSGFVDLFVANYTEAKIEHHVKRTIDGFHCYPSPLDYDPAPDILFRNHGDGTFGDISEAAGISAVAGNGMGVVCADFDENGHTDIFVANDMGPNFLYANDGSGQFKEAALARGLAYNFQGKPNGNMGVDVGDFDNDGRLDLFSTTYASEMPVLYHNQGAGLFRDATLAAAAGTSLTPHINWGTGFADLDNDGHLDLLIANGGIDQNVHQWRIGTAYKLPNLLLKNTGEGRFIDVSDRAGDAMQVAQSSRGVALGDLNNDGTIDLVVLNSRATPTVIRNDTPVSQHWLALQLHGTRSNRDGIGSKVWVTAGGRTQVQQRLSGRGYQSHWGSILHFGLGNAQRIDRIEVHWSSGRVDRIENAAADQLISVVEGLAD